MKSDSVPQNRPLYHPAFWGYWLLLALLWAIVQLPWKWRMGLGAFAGRLAFRLADHRRIVTQINIAKAFPEISEAERTTLTRRFSESIGQGFIETGMGWFWSDRALKKISRYEGDARSMALIADPEVPLVLIGSHSTMMELGVRLLGIYTDSAGMYRPLKNRFYDRWIKYQRGRAATELVHFKDMRHVFRVLKSGGNLWYALDQDMGPRVSVFAPFFGIEAASVNVLPKLKQRTGARWIPVFMWREGREYVVKVLPEIPSLPGDDDSAVMARVNAVYESEIRAHPEQYFWVHRRYKTRPDGSAHDYPDRRAVRQQKNQGSG